MQFKTQTMMHTLASVATTFHAVQAAHTASAILSATPERLDLPDLCVCGTATDLQPVDFCRDNEAACAQSLGVHRHFMPQLSEECGLGHLADSLAAAHSVAPETVLPNTLSSVSLSSLVPIQGNAHAAKVDALFRELFVRAKHPDVKFQTSRFDKEPSNFADKLRQLTRDTHFVVLQVWDAARDKLAHFLLDGHHRYFAMARYNEVAQQTGLAPIESVPATVLHIPNTGTVAQVLGLPFDNDSCIVHRQLDDQVAVLKVDKKEDGFCACS